MKQDYFKQRDIENLEKLRALRDELPEFCTQFFIGIEGTTSVLTRLGYARDLAVFFHYLLSEVRIFKDREDVFDFRVSDLDLVKTHHLEAFLEYLGHYTYNGKSYSNGERGKERKISAIRTFYKYFYKRDLIETNPASKVDLPKIHEKEIVRLERDEMFELLETVDIGSNMSDHEAAFHRHTRTRDLAIITLMLGTGIRVSECVGLNLDDFDFAKNAFTVTRKGGNRVILYFPDEVKTALQNWLSSRDSLKLEKKLSDTESAMFVSMQMKRIGVRAVQNLVKKYSARVTTLKTITPHKLRSTYGTNLYRETRDIHIVAEVLGHSDVNTTKKHYAAISEDIRRNAALHVKLKKDDDDT